MTEFSITFSRALDNETAAAELAAGVEEELGGASEIAGGLLLATAAAGPQGPEVGRRLSQRWPGAELAGTSFEGLVSGGRVWRDRPALGFLGWRRGDGEPAIAAFEPTEHCVERIADGILSSVGASSLEASDLVLLFPDAHGLPPIETMLASLEERLGCPAIAGAAAAGVEGAPPIAWAGRGICEDRGLISLVVPNRAGVGASSTQVRTAAGSRSASDWLEVTSCRSRWIDRLEGESALELVRRELKLGGRDALEPHLGRLLIRLRRRGFNRDGETTGTAGHDEERYVVGIDDRRGAFSLPVEVERGDLVSMAWPDAVLARERLRDSLAELGSSPWLLQFSCRARDAELHGDGDLESAWVAAHSKGRQVLGTVAPFQLGPGPSDPSLTRLLVHSSVLAALIKS